MSKQKELVRLEEKLKNDAGLPLRESNLVFGEGSVDSPVMFIGEAPGLREDQLRRPFVGQSGKLLDKLIESVGWKRGDVYITNIVKRRPPGNRDPLPEEIEAYAPCLKRQIEIINPKIIATLGRFSMNYFAPAAKITRDQGKVFRLENKRLLVPLFHPAAALRSTANLEALAKSFKKLPVALEKYEELVNNASAAKEESKNFSEERRQLQEKLF
ncbi:uracil-DNA glycosylase [Candidatus Wolfebacteria bacterium]|nr:uracil-DNA glycosylase [Candidatus Wolfebacteria bacterium]